MHFKIGAGIWAILIASSTQLTRTFHGGNLSGYGKQPWFAKMQPKADCPDAMHRQEVACFFG